MRKLSLLLLSAIISFTLFAQTAEIKKIITATPMGEALAPFHFLASDELMGRSATRPEIHIAARYIAEQFRAAGLKEVPGTKSFFQAFQFPVKSASTTGSLVVDGKRLEMAKDVVQFSGTDLTLTAPVVYAGYGGAADLASLDVKGKIVITELGNATVQGMDAFNLMAEKQRLLQEKGAVALVERFKDFGVPFAGVAQFMLHDHPAYFEAEKSALPTFVVQDADSSMLQTVKGKSINASLTAAGNKMDTFTGKNVMGWIEGADPKLKGEYIALTAHYDHVGVASAPKMEEGKMDSIYNGARDNAIGTTAVINAARYFKNNPPKRSVLFIAWTAEEMGLIGSKYYAENPVLPLNKMVYNLNIDNASYNDTTIVTVIGLGRTSADTHIKNGAAAFGLQAKPDPAPEQNLFDRSDNVSLAAKGVPAPTYSLGIRAFDAEIQKRYHQLSDEVGNFSLTYGLRYIRSYILAAQLIANDPKQPLWNKGDKYEAAWKKLFNQ